jgi:exopolysaccharide biosynthesis WecB/TagA/CpsF family protein
MSERVERDEIGGDVRGRVHGDVRDWVGLPEKRDVYGVGVSCIDSYEAVVEAVVRAARAERPLTVSLLDVHALMLAATRRAMGRAIARADIVTPDGQPVRWALNALHGAGLRRRVCGSTLMLETCAAAEREGLPMYLYGSVPAVLEPLHVRLRCLYPRLAIAGVYASRMRPRVFPPPVDEPEDRDDAVRIRASGARILLVGLGCPLQEMWAAAQRERLGMPALCVGAAFDFLAGRKARAPVWMQERGLEWLHRLAHDPRRLAGRYARYNALYLFYLARALCTGSSPRRLASANA